MHTNGRKRAYREYYYFSECLDSKEMFGEVEGTEIFKVSIIIVIFLGEFCPRGKGAMRLTLCEAPTHEKRPDHNTGNDVPYSFR